MRIIGGRLGKRVLRPPAGLPVRPTTDKAKEALFSILFNYIDFEEVCVLDLFAGTGSISFEFASRGAIEVTAVDNNLRCVRFIQQVQKEFELDNLVVLKTDAMKFLAHGSQQYDLIFCDPPYDFPQIADIPELVFSKNLLARGALLIVEHPESIKFESHPGFLFKRNYSKVHFSFFEG